jgi:hypothetical protein
MSEPSLKALTFALKALEHREVRELLCQADIVLGRDVSTRQMVPFFGNETTARVQQTGQADVKCIMFDLDFDSDQLNYLVAAVRTLKGSCCIGDSESAPGTRAPASKVRVHDAATNRTVNIPACELAPGMIRTRIAGEAEEVWVEGSSLGASGFQHPPFSPELRREMEWLRDALHEVRPLTAEEWEDGFRRDVNMAAEIDLWLLMARCFQNLTAGRTLTLDQKKDIFKVILTTVTNGAEYVTQTINPATLSKESVREIAAFVERMHRAGNPRWPAVPEGRGGGTAKETLPPDGDPPAGV